MAGEQAPHLGESCSGERDHSLNELTYLQHRKRDSPFGRRTTSVRHTAAELQVVWARLFSLPWPGMTVLNDIKFGLEVMNDFSHMPGSAVVAKPEEMSIT